ncbi:hypothetical protein E2C01_031197 [Portunus trituberculatus]|uniref:Uncharacterized protein n=1 Tax=Portunus trituberculatus TaxID=210409 RepID=A0A5B7EX11_PORTR|nr:hypothetical protein [Portunus trituberculatus]
MSALSKTQVSQSSNKQIRIKVFPALQLESPEPRNPLKQGDPRLGTAAMLVKEADSTRQRYSDPEK